MDTKIYIGGRVKGSNLPMDTHILNVDEIKTGEKTINTDQSEITSKKIDLDDLILSHISIFNNQNGITIENVMEKIKMDNDHKIYNFYMDKLLAIKNFEKIKTVKIIKIMMIIYYFINYDEHKKKLFDKLMCKLMLHSIISNDDIIFFRKNILKINQPI